MTTNIVSNVKAKLVWQADQLDKHCFIPSMSLVQGECLQLVCPEYCQPVLLESWFSEQSTLSVEITGKKGKIKGVGHAVAVVLNGRALIANLTIKENIMLPFLYHHDLKMSGQVQLQLQRVAEMFGLDAILSERAGLRGPLIHSLVSLSRSVLQQANFIIMQQPCASMDVKEAETFSELAKQALKGLDAGMVYLTTSVDDQGGFSFVKSIDMHGFNDEH